MPRRPAIHRTAIVAPDVVVGEGTVIGPYAVLVGPCTVGADCWIGPHTVIGTTAEHVDEMIVQRVPDDGTARSEDEMWFGAHGKGVVIGDRTIVREQSAIHSGTSSPTLIGSDVFVMNTSYVAHDVVIGDRARLSPHATLGGHVVIGHDANIGMASAVHQRRIIGAGAMVGMQAGVVKDVRPFELVKGLPARSSGLNLVALERGGYATDDVDALARFYDGEADAPPETFRAIIDRWQAARG